MEITQCSLIDKWRKKDVVIYTVEYYSTMEKEDILLAKQNKSDRGRQELYDITYM